MASLSLHADTRLELRCIAQMTYHVQEKMVSMQVLTHIMESVSRAASATEHAVLV